MLSHACADQHVYLYFNQRINRTHDSGLEPSGSTYLNVPKSIDLPFEAVTLHQWHIAITTQCTCPVLSCALKCSTMAYEQMITLREPNHASGQGADRQSHARHGPHDRIIAA